MEKLHPGARWLFRFRAYWTIIIWIIVVGYILFLFRRFFNVPAGVTLGIVAILVVTIIFGEIFARMSYNRWFYELTDTELRLERGIIWKKYSNVPYERVQNVDVQRGVIARILGFSTINIHTAGYAASYGRRGAPGSEGYIPAVSVDKAEKIRNFLVKKISKRGKSGL